MASRRPPGDAPDPPAPSRRRRPDDGGLRALGNRIDEGGGAPRSEERLRALGQQMGGGGGGGHRPVRGAAGGDGGGGGGGRRPVRGAAGGEGGGGRRRRWSTRRKVLTPLVAIVVLALAVAGAAYGYARFRYDQIHKVDVAGEVPAASGKPFNMLVIGSDSRVGNVQGTAHFGTSTKVGGQRSDVDMIWHVAPATKRITILSIPRDTLVSMVGKNISTFGRLNRINASYNSGPSLLVQTIEANFGIPISHVVQVDFGGLVGAVNALGGIHMDFPYPTRTVNPTTGVNESGLDVTTPGCQLLTGTKALAVARSRDYQYQANGTWQYTPAGDLGRIKRQDAFMKALIDEAKTKYNPLTLNALLGSIPQGVAIDSSFSMDGLIGLAESFHSIDATTISTMTLPTMSRGYVTPWGDVLFVDQPAAQQLLVSVFGGELTHPTSPPPNTTLEPATPPAVTASAPASGHSAAPPAPPPPAASFDPTPCRPS